jgi:hypothetical protein
MPFLHLAPSEYSAKGIREALRALDRDCAVLGGSDVLAEGPLHDIDELGASRIAWWSKLAGHQLPDDQSRKIVDSEIWRRARESNADVMLWHGPHPSERLFALRACFHLRATPERLYEVSIPSPPPRRRLRSFYDAVAIIGAERLASAWETRARIHDVAARAQRWEELRASAGETVRALEGDDIVLRPLTTYDDEIVAACEDAWASSSLVVGHVLANNATTDRLLTWRVRELIHGGVLEARGDVNRLGLPEEVKATTSHGRH